MSWEDGPYSGPHRSTRPRRHPEDAQMLGATAGLVQGTGLGRGMVILLVIAACLVFLGPVFFAWDAVFLAKRLRQYASLPRWERWGYAMWDLETVGHTKGLGLLFGPLAVAFDLYAFLHVGEPVVMTLFFAWAAWCTFLVVVMIHHRLNAKRGPCPTRVNKAKCLRFKGHAGQHAV